MYFVLQLDIFALRQGWPYPLYEQVKTEGGMFRARVIVNNDAYDTRTCYETYEEAKEGIASFVLRRLCVQEEGIPSTTPVDAILTAHRGNGQMKPDFSSSAAGTYFVCDETGRSVDGSEKRDGSIYWMMVSNVQKRCHERMISGLLWLRNQGCKHITLHLESYDISTIQTILTALHIRYVMCGKRQHTIEVLDS